MILYGSIANQNQHSALTGFGLIVDPKGFSPTYDSFEPSFAYFCSSANMYLNLIVAYELFGFLRDSHNRKRRNPPTFARVSMQALAVYALSGVVFILRYLDNSNNFNEEETITFFFMVSAGIPTLLLSMICFIIWYRNYMPSIGGRMRELALFFARIVLVFIFIWIPAIILITIGGDNSNTYNAQSDRDNSRQLCIGLLLCAIQPIASTCIAMTKSDVKCSVIDVITLSYFRHRWFP